MVGTGRRFENFRPFLPLSNQTSKPLQIKVFAVHAPSTRRSRIQTHIGHKSIDRHDCNQAYSPVEALAIATIVSSRKCMHPLTIQKAPLDTATIVPLTSGVR